MDDDGGGLSFDLPWQRCRVSSGSRLDRLRRRMIAPLTANTQAILLLMAPLLAGKGSNASELLSLGEYNRFARILRDKQKQPADLIGPEAAELIAVCGEIFGRTRLEELL